MFKVNIKPLSINEAYRGRRFKTQKYKDYEQELWYKLPNKNIPDGELALELEFGFSNKGTDIDNCIKNFTDILQKKYLFNDNRIYKLRVDKKIVKKGKEYIKYKIYGTQK